MKTVDNIENQAEASVPVELHFPRTNGSVDDAIDHLIGLAGGIEHPGIVREMILAALKAGQENKGPADLKLINSTLKEMRFTSKVFGPYKHVKKVSVFGSARTQPDSPLYGVARNLGRRLATAGYMVITGGGPGIMQAVNEGAGPEHSFGVNIRLPFEQKPNPVLEGNPRHIMFKYFFTRKVAFLKEADAVILFPGGFGTLDEALETITLVQTGKRYCIPIILVDEPGGRYWDRCLAFFRAELLGRGYIGEADFSMIETCNQVDLAVDIIAKFYSRYHSLRFVGGTLVVRMTSPLRQNQVEHLNESFKDLLIEGGRIYLSAPLEEEFDEPDLLHLNRLVIDFNRKDYGRLRRLIDAVNDVD